MCAQTSYKQHIREQMLMCSLNFEIQRFYCIHVNFYCPWKWFVYIGYYHIFPILFTDLPTCTDFRGTYRFWPSITISRFHAGVYRFWKMREFLGLSDFDLFCFRRYSRILPAFCTYRQSRRCVAAINSPPYVMNQC